MLLLTGPAGSGKTFLILERLCAAIQRRDSGVRLLTPKVAAAHPLDGGRAGAVSGSVAETAGRLLSVTPRTARRLLATLVDEGLAWPLPPSRSPQPGRPRQAYRLVIEKLGPPRTR